MNERVTAIALVAFALALALASEKTARAAAIGDVAQAGVASLAHVPATAIVVSAPLVSDVPVSKADELAARIAALVAGKIGNAARTHAQPALLSAARALAAKSGALVFVQPEIVKGELRATFDVYPVQKNTWDRVRNPLPPPIAHGFASARVDAEVRAFLPAIVLEQASVRRSRLDEADVLAAACGDVDGDGGMELLLVSRARVLLGKIQHGTFVASRVARLADFAKRVPAPLREPIASASIGDDGTIWIGTTDRGGARLSADLSAVATFARLPLGYDGGAVCVDADPSASALASPFFDCDEGAKARSDAPFARYDAFAEAMVAERAGGRSRIAAAREPSGKVRVRLEGTAPRTIDGAGAQLAIGDLDQDGAPEIAHSLDGSDDAIVVATLGASEPRRRLRLAAPGGVRALAVCPPESSGAPSLVAVVGSELWIVR